MAKSGKGRGKPTGPERQGRALTGFARTKQFDKAVSKLGSVGIGKALAAAQQFQREWQASTTDEDIAPGFDLKQLYAQPGHYRVLQIRAGSDFRLALTLLVSQDQAYWVHAWKKTRLNNRTETELAQTRAKTLWNEVQSNDKNRGGTA